MRFVGSASSTSSCTAQALSLGAFWIAGYAGGLFVPFTDATSGKETYGGGRYLLDTIKSADFGSDARDDTIVLDFNYAYHPSCAYDPRWVCPLAPPDSRLGYTSPSGRAVALNQAQVEFVHVSKQYGPQGAVVDLSLLVPAGDICVLVGPSGCGKTTSLKMVNRLVEPSSGQVLIDGQDIMKVEVTELRRRIGYVIQQIGLFPHQTVAENIGTVPRLLGWPRERTRKRVEELLELIGLDPARVRERYPSQLSGGERQRIGVARAMAAEPPVMLMDEPFGAVDPIVRERLQNEFLRLHRTLGTTVLFVTHDIDEAIKMGTRVAVMQQGGHLAQYAPPVELLAHPANDFVARFVGVDRGLKRLSLLRVADVAAERRRRRACRRHVQQRDPRRA